MRLILIIIDIPPIAKQLLSKPFLFVALKNLAGIIWSVSTFSIFSGTAVDVTTEIALLLIIIDSKRDLHLIILLRQIFYL